MAAEIVTQPGPGRASYEMYYAVHKGIRMAHGRVLQKMATCDPTDRDQRAALVEALNEHMTMCRRHLIDENDHIHAALEARAPGTSEMAAHEHDGHEQSFADLAALAGALVTADNAAAPAALRALYRRFTQFMAEDLEHMDGEEYMLQPLLQVYFTDEELHEMTNRIVASIPDSEMPLFTRAMLAAASLPEREAMLSGMKAAMPADVFEGYMATVANGPWQFGDWAAFDRI